MKSHPFTTPSSSTAGDSVAPSLVTVGPGVDEVDLQRIKTKGEQKAFDPNRVNNKNPKLIRVKNDDLTNQLASIKSIDPGKPHKKLGIEQSISDIAIKQKGENKENLKSKEKISNVSGESSYDWKFGFDKLIDDLSNNRDVTTSRKTKTLGRRYDQKLSAQRAIDNNEVAPLPTPLSEQESESESEAPVKFRGKFKSIKDKSSNERIILTYASHSDESCTELIPDEDASDYELELQKEISFMKKKKHTTHNHKPRRRNRSTSSNDDEFEDRRNQRKNQNSTPKDISNKKLESSDKSNGKEDTDFSPDSSESGSNSSDSDDDDSDNSGNSSSESQPARNRRKAASDSSDDDEDMRRRTRRRPALKARARQLSDSSDDENKVFTKRTRRFKLRNLISDDDDEDDDGAYKPPRSSSNKRNCSKRRKSSSSDEKSSPVSTRIKKFKSNFFQKDDSNGRNKRNITKDSGLDKSNKSTTSESDSQKSTKTIKNISKRNMLKSESESDDDHRKLSKQTLDSDSEDSRSCDYNKISSGAAKRSSKITSTESSDEEDDEQDDTRDSILLKLEQQRLQELQREDVLIEKARRLEMTRKITEKLDSLQEERFRQTWAKPKFGSGEKFYAGWQEGFLKFKKEFARLPRKLLYNESLAAICLDEFSQQSSNTKKFQSSKTSPAKNTRSKSSNNVSSIIYGEKNKDQIQTANSVVQNFFDRVVVEDGRSGADSDTGSSVRKFALGTFPAFGTLRTHTGLTPTPSVAPSMMASDESDSESLASRRSPASDSAPLARRKSVASQLIKKFKRKYNRVNAGWLNRPRAVLTSDTLPRLLPTPGLDSNNQMDLRKLKTFFRKDTVDAYGKAFEVLFENNGVNVFSPCTLNSRTRKETKQLLDVNTIKSVFGDVPHTTETPLIAKKRVAKNRVKCNDNMFVSSIVGDDSTSLPASTRASTPSDSGALSAGEDDSELPSDISLALGGSLETLRKENGEPIFSNFGKEVKPHFRVKKHKRKFNKSSGFDYLKKKKKPVPKSVDDESTSLLKKKTVRFALYLVAVPMVSLV